jgi:hypothetical protein
VPPEHIERHKNEDQKGRNDGKEKSKKQHELDYVTEGDLNGWLPWRRGARRRLHSLLRLSDTLRDSHMYLYAWAAFTAWVCNSFPSLV